MKKIGLIKFSRNTQPPNMKPNPQGQRPFDHTQPSANCRSCLTLSLLPYQGCHTRTCVGPRAGHLSWAELSHSLPLPPPPCHHPEGTLHSILVNMHCVELHYTNSFKPKSNILSILLCVLYIFIHTDFSASVFTQY